jgi:hypothetical protein
MQALRNQFDIAWALTSYHLDGLTTEECLWRPARVGLHVNQGPDGAWQADWPDREGYDIGPPSIAWITWHITFWWSMTLNHSFGDGSLTREQVTWPGSADAVRTRIGELQAGWLKELEGLSDDDYRSTARTRWPIQDREFADIAGWLNVELMKNAAEIGYARFLYAVKPG